MKWVWIVLGICAAVFLIGFIVTLAGCDPQPVDDAPRPAPQERTLEPIQPERSGLDHATLREPPIPMRYKWDVARHPRKAQRVCERACERIGMEFHATERAESEVGWRCLCGL